MRAWQVQAAGEPIDVLQQVEVDPPQPGPGQIRVQVAAAGIGLPDVFMCRGVYPLTPPLPFTPGQEFAGVVTAAGDGVDIEVGARVMSTSAFVEGHGSFAEECLANAATTFPVPAALDDASAAGFWIPHMTGWVGLVDRGAMTAGETLAVLGAAGGSGIAAVQLGRALGATVIAVVSSDAKADFCRNLGADETIVQDDRPVADTLREVTGGRGVDVIYDPVGGEIAEDAFTALARGGRLLAIGFASGRWPSVRMPRLVQSNTSVVGVMAGGSSREHLDEIHRHLDDLLTAGTLRNAVTHRAPFDDLPDAVQQVGDRAVIGKLVMDPPARS